MRQTYTALEVRKIRAKYRAIITKLESQVDWLNAKAEEKKISIPRLPVKTPGQIAAGLKWVEELRNAPRTQG